MEVGRPFRLMSAGVSERQLGGCEAANIDALLPPRAVSDRQRDGVGIGRTRPGREGVRADHDPAIAKPQDRGGAVGGCGLEDLKPVIGGPTLLAAEIAVEARARLVLQYIVGVAGCVGLRRLAGRRIPVDPSIALAIEDIAVADPGRRRPTLISGG